jgi:hypothetical protein
MIMARQTSMDRSEPSTSTNERLARLLTLAVDGAGKPRCEVARSVGMHKDTLLRVLRGDRAIALEEAERILLACGVPAQAALLLGMTDQLGLAEVWLRNDAAAFLDAMLAALPSALHTALGDRAGDVRPRWARGTSELVARALARHLTEFEERDLALTAGR